MKKLKDFYLNNRIYCILMIISTICLFTILGSIVYYFISQTQSSVYGHRLEDINEHPVETELADLKQSLSDNEKVIYVNTDVRGKIIYINLEVNKDLSNEDIQSICGASLAKLSESQKLYYDVQFIVKREGLNPYLGSKSASQTIIAWANYSYTDDDTSTDEGE